ncbi:MAG TPA: ABC transporter permease, partial [Jatrophihabitans sp.]|nr:ABC transporter permease [Jatrophihabitans sp.]
MRTVSVRNLRSHKVRLTLTVISVLLGTAFVAGSFIFTDTLKKSFDTIFATSDKGIDARVQPSKSFAAGVPVSTIPVIEKVPGVRAVQPQVNAPIVLVDPKGKRIDTGGAPSVGSDWTSGNTVQEPPKLIRGHAPQRQDEIAINDSAAGKYHVDTGDRVKVVLPNTSIVTATIVGVYDISFDTGGFLGALFTPDQARSLFTDGRHYTAVDVAGDQGLSETTLAARIDKVLPASLEVK